VGRGDKYERELCELLEKARVTSIRSAGSMGKGDVIGLPTVEGALAREIQHVVLESKKTQENAYYTGSNDYTKEQWRACCDVAKFHPYYYAVRWTTGSYDDRGWEFFEVVPSDKTDYPALRRGEGVPPEKVFPCWPDRGYRATN